ncbi:MAG: M23 family metallopeptidase [Treponema sp.]|nr:M23 family metallopeptidase [Treponema sp.]
MFFKTKTVSILALSVFGFCFGLCLTGFVITESGKVNNRKGVGGFETATVPEYNENLESFLVENSEKLEEELVKSETTQEESLITYETYRVKKGDMIGYIADEFGITQDTIISVNNIKQSRLIQVGQYLKIPSMTGIIYTIKKTGETPATIAEKYEIDAEKCAKVNAMAVNTELTAGASIFVPDAELDWTTRQEINGDLFHRPIHARYWLSSPYGWRDSPFNTGKRSFHGGIDMACSKGTPIYASLDGVVTATGYNATYGNYVIVAHHSGYKTLYAHMSAITCRKGNFVYTNTMIGRVGSTGMSTGPHLHFTVYKNGKTVNPSLLLN